MGLDVCGNSTALELIRKMIQKGREQRSIIIHGEKGLGKKQLARYIAASYLCSRHDGEPCGKCRSCTMVMHGTHPDIINVQANANGNYIVDDSIRPIVADSAVMPNESRYKVYIIPDLDRSVNTAVAVQNILLKLIEEPPAHVVIIMTARSKEIFLPTIVSRTLSLSVSCVSEQECMQYLRENTEQLSESQLAEAVSAGRGNIGRCLSYLEKDSFYDSVQAARALCDASATRDGYSILAALHGVEGKKALARDCITLFGEIVRDACADRLGETDEKLSVSCYAQGARKLCSSLSASACARLYDTVCDYTGRIDANCNLSLTLNSFAAKLSQAV